jgi:hypothetical protein
LCNVKNVEWFTQDDGQLVSLTINFIPAEWLFLKEDWNAIIHWNQTSHRRADDPLRRWTPSWS